MAQSAVRSVGGGDGKEEMITRLYVHHGKANHRGADREDDDGSARANGGR